jgi:hypothetical protein
LSDESTNQIQMLLGRRSESETGQEPDKTDGSRFTRKSQKIIIISETFFRGHSGHILVQFCFPFP